MIEQSQSSYRRPLVAAFIFVAAVHLIIAAGVLMSGCRKEKVEFEDLEPADAPPPISSEWSESADDIPSAPVEGGSERSPFGDTATNVQTPQEDRAVLPPPPSSTGPRFSSNNDRARATGGMVEVSHTKPVTETPSSPAADSRTSAPTVQNPPPATAAPATSPSVREYKVQSGDSFYRIASKFGVNFKDIERANPNVNPRRLPIGQVIIVPSSGSTASVAASNTGTTTATPATGRTYKVRSGDSLSAIAVRYKTTVDRIMKANNLRSSRINIGQELVIPAP